MFEIVFFINIQHIKKEKNAKQSIFIEKYEIVLHTPHSDARCPVPVSQSLAKQDDWQLLGTKHQEHMMTPSPLPGSDSRFHRDRGLMPNA